MLRRSSGSTHIVFFRVFSVCGNVFKQVMAKMGYHSWRIDLHGVQEQKSEVWRKGTFLLLLMTMCHVCVLRGLPTHVFRCMLVHAEKPSCASMAVHIISYCKVVGYLVSEFVYPFCFSCFSSLDHVILHTASPRLVLWPVPFLTQYFALAPRIYRQNIVIVAIVGSANHVST